MMISIHQLVVILLLAELASQIQLEAVKPESLRSRDKSTERLVFIKICKLKPIRIVPACLLKRPIFVAVEPNILNIL
jgi:hypothetical protein